MKKIISILLVLVFVFGSLLIFSSCKQGEQGIQGEKGDRGEQGIQGEKGDRGEQGIQGEKGDRGEQGIQGEKGSTGRGIFKAEVIDGYLWVTYTDDLENPINIGCVQGEVPVVEHFFTDWIVIQYPTCLSFGFEQRYCTQCGYTECRTINLLEHNYYVSNLISPSTIEEGYVEYTCSDCGTIYKTSYVEPINFAVTFSNRNLVGYTGEKDENLVIPLLFNNNGILYRVTSIDWAAFIDCGNLMSVTIPDSVMNIGESAFFSCSKLNNIVIPNSVLTIGAHAFYGCSSLTSITIPNSVKSISDYAFQHCSSLTSIFYSGTIDEWKSISLGTDWNYAVPTSYVVCLDGVVALN